MTFLLYDGKMKKKRKLEVSAVFNYSSVGVEKRIQTKRDRLEKWQREEKLQVSAAFHCRPVAFHDQIKTDPEACVCVFCFFLNL